MVFKRREKRPLWQVAFEFFWPRGGWSRAAQYVRHRLHRLPDTPEKIARGIFAGVFTTFTPFYGLHFLTAAIIAFVMRGNILAALLATFFGNPLTYVPIGVISMRMGYFLLGTPAHSDDHIARSLGGKFMDAGEALQHNFMAMFTDATVDWHSLKIFYDEVFFPYLIGGIIPGLVAATICYIISVPLIRAYQKRRSGAIKAKLAALKAKAKRSAEVRQKTD
ncbi:DNA-directed RNA polymerase subunit omega [Rhodobacteraceae bacterium EhC02]|nr:DNA-directed RNA polymerase subunit omega [Rhodobacteraceae bacterium EhC02]